ncbi:MAG TPA: LysR family transcriptional regulator [Steroidobacteraceae bacterium]|jgi:DNA-binding transcriptional LysR family regulator
MDLSQLKRFIATVEGGSLGKAAEVLNISQPGLSKSIHQLEADFGAKLLDRGPKGVTSTAFGDAVYSRAKRILAEWRHLENERVALFNGLVGHVTIGVARGTGFLGRVIPAASAKLTNARYEVHLTVVSGVAEELVRALRLGDLDFAVGVLDFGSGAADLVEEVLFYDRCGLFVDAQHPLSRMKSVGIEDLARYCWLFSSDAASLREALFGLARSKSVEPRRTFIDSNSVVYLVSTLIGSEFVGLLSMDSVEDAVNAGNLVEVVLDPAQRSEVAVAAVERPIGFLHRADTTLSPLALALRDEIRGLCQKLGFPLLQA